MFSFSPFFRIKILLPGWAKSTRKTRKSKKAHSPKKGENKEKKVWKKEKIVNSKNLCSQIILAYYKKLGGTIAKISR